MGYSVEFKRSARKELADLPQDIHARVLRAVMDLSENPRPAGCKKLCAENCGASVQETIASFTKSGTIRLLFLLSGLRIAAKSTALYNSIIFPPLSQRGFFCPSNGSSLF